MMIERFASPTDGFLVVIAIKRDQLAFVAGTVDVQAGSFTHRDWNPATRHDSMVPSYRQVTMVMFTIITKVSRTVYTVVFGFLRSPCP